MIKLYPLTYFANYVRHYKNHQYYQYEVRREFTYELKINPNKNLIFYAIGYDSRYELFISESFNLGKIDENNTLSFLVDNEDKEVHVYGCSYHNKYHSLTEYFFNMRSLHYFYLKSLINFLIKNRDIFEYNQLILHHHAYYRTLKIDYNIIDICEFLLWTKKVILYQDLGLINLHVNNYLKFINNCKVSDINWEEIKSRLPQKFKKLENLLNQLIEKYFYQNITYLFNDLFIINQNTENLLLFDKLKNLILFQLNFTTRKFEYFYLKNNNGRKNKKN